jgi:copper transport protein
VKALRRTTTALLLVVVVLLAAAAPASAHAQLVSTTPADGAHVDPAPKEVSLRFSEKVSLKLGGVRVLNTDGERVDKDDARVDGDTVTVGLREGLGDGPYVVAWNVVSADSHPVNGAFTFVVGAGANASKEQVASLLAVPSDKAWRIAAGVGRFASYAGILLAAGAVVFLTVVDRRRPSKGIVQLVIGAAAIGVAGLLVQIPLQAAIATETGWRALRSPSRWVDVLSNSGLRWATLLGVVGAAIVALAVRALASERERSWAPWAGLVGASIAFVSFSLTGHTRVTTPGWLVIPADSVHVAAAGAWFGGLVLLVVAWTARRRDGDAVAAARLVDRFSQMAVVTIVAVAVSGVILGWKEVGSLSALTSTRYGWTLVAKLCVVAFVGGLAAYNHWKLVPDIRRTGKRVVSATGAATTTEASVGGPGAAKTTRSALAWRRLDTTVRSEIVGLVVVLAITSALVAITPAREATSTGGVFSSTVAFRGGTLSLVVDPAKVGLNEIHVYVLDAEQRPDDALEQMTLRMSLPSQSVGPFERVMDDAGPGHWSLDSSDLTIPGAWELTAVGQVSKFEDQQATVTVPIHR